MCSKLVVFCVLLLLTVAVLPATCFGHKDVEQHATRRSHSRHPSRRHRAANDGALRFEPQPYSKKLELNSPGKIHCKVAGGVSPTVQWFLNSADPLPEGVSSVNGTLLIAEAAKRHVGQYTCKATDGDHSITAEIQLDIVVSPKVVQPSPNQQMHVSAGGSAVLVCEASGDPLPTTHWDRNLTVLNQQQEGVEVEGGENASNARIILLNNGSLLIRSVEERDNDRYGCTAGSAAGLARNELFLIVHPEGEPLPTEANGVGGKAVIVSISVAFAYMILVLALMMYCRRRRLKRRERGEKIELEMAEGREKLVEEEDDKKKMNGTAAHNGRLLHDKDSGADNSEISGISRASKKSGQYEHLAIPRNLVTDRITLGRGEFGDVQLGKIDINLVKKHRNRGDAGEVKIRPVLVKVLTAKDENILSEFRRQLELLTRVKHENVARLIGLVNDTEPHCMIIEHTDWGDLKTFLLATRPAEAPSTDNKRTAPLSGKHKMALTAQLARANVPLASGRMTHRDIAARNCLITSHLQLKLSFPAMTRGPHSQEYYKLHDRVIPLRWMPLEAVSDGEYSTKSDVYMFAATVWEIYTTAELPFVKLNDNSVMERLKSNTLEWQVPDSMPQKLAELLKRCWSLSPADRPQFTEIVDEMKVILQDLPSDQEEVQNATNETEP